MSINYIDQLANMCILVVIYNSATIRSRTWTVIHFRCIPDMVENFISENEFSDLTTYELLCGKDVSPSVTPLKFTGINRKDTVGG